MSTKMIHMKETTSDILAYGIDSLNEPNKTDKVF